MRLTAVAVASPAATAAPRRTIETIDDGTIGHDEGLRLLATDSIGRVALTVGALPMIQPVSYRVTGDAIELAGSDPLLERAARIRQIVCFEAGAAPTAVADGWSVVVVGRLEPARVAAPAQPARHEHGTARLPTALVRGSVTRRPASGPHRS